MSERRRHFNIDPNMFLPEGEKLYPTPEEDHRMDTTSTKEEEDMPFLAKVDPNVRDIVLDILNDDMPDKEREKCLVDYMGPDAFSDYRSWKSRNQSNSADTSLFMYLLSPTLAKMAKRYVAEGLLDRLDRLMKPGAVTDAALGAYRKWKTQQAVTNTEVVSDDTKTSDQRGKQSSTKSDDTLNGYSQKGNNPVLTQSVVPDPAVFLIHLNDTKRADAELFLSAGDMRSLEKLFRGNPRAHRYYRKWKDEKSLIDDQFTGNQHHPSNESNGIVDTKSLSNEAHRASDDILTGVQYPKLPSYAEATKSSMYKNNATNCNQKPASSLRPEKVYGSVENGQTKQNDPKSLNSHVQISGSHSFGPNTYLFGRSKDASESPARRYTSVSDQHVTIPQQPISPSVGVETVFAQPRYTATKSILFGQSNDPFESFARSSSSTVVSDHNIVQQPISPSIGIENVSAWPNHTAPQPSTYGMPPKSILINHTNLPTDLPRTRPSIDKKSDHLNILVMGETGVGKSTFINGLVNYLKYNSLQEALDGGVEVLIDSAFTLTDDQFKSHRISCESTIWAEKNGGSNENTLAGQSATQDAKAYVFSCGSAGQEKKIRLIDTPGIGDTRGPDQDKINFDKILSFISKYSELHAVCILIKPNTARLTVAFRFCIDELLVHLHKSASKNILFCFTNTRGTLYKPGDTLPTLRHHLQILKDKTNVDIPINKSTVFCFDNESFRFLCALRQKFPFSETDIDNFAASWKQSVQETEKLMASIVQLPVHSTRDTLSLNNTRKLIVALARPLGEMVKTQLVNKQMIEEKTDTILRNAEAGLSLRGQLHVHQTILMAEQLDEPQTVCTSRSCVEELQISPESSALYTKYKTICHQKCHLSGVEAEVVPNRQLTSCAAFYGGKCTECGCSWETHMHIKYRLKPRVTSVVDPDVEASIHRKDDANLTLNLFLDNEKKKFEDLRMEYKFLVESCAEFAVFMDQNSITPYFDSFAQYIDHLIKEEDSKALVGGSSRLAAQLKKLSLYYCNKVLSIKESVSRGSRSVKSMDEIEVMVNELGKLKYCGATVNAVKEMNRNAANQDSDDGHIVDVGNSVLGGALSKMFSSVWQK